MVYCEEQESVHWCCPDYASGKEESTQFAIKLDCQGARFGVAGG